MKVHHLETQWEERTKWEKTPFLLSTTQSSFTSKISGQLMYLPIVRIKLKGPNLWQGQVLKRKEWLGCLRWDTLRKGSAKEYKFKKIFSSFISAPAKIHFQMTKNQHRLGTWGVSASYLQSAIFYRALQNEFTRKHLVHSSSQCY